MRATLLFAIAGLVAVAVPVLAADEPAPATSNDAEAVYLRVLEKRAEDVLDVLKLEDPAKAARVRQAVIAHYRGLRKLHDARDARIQSYRDRPHRDQAELDGQIQAERAQSEAASAALHERFVAGLSADLSPEQIDRVKDKMTYNKLQVTYNAYLEMLPDLTPEQKRTVSGMLEQARDRAAYAGSAEEKSEIFDKFKGRINNYLTAQGYDLKLASKQWAERRKQAK